jgi:hypothetical protein
MNEESRDESPLSAEELRWLRRMLEAYRKAVEDEVNPLIPGIQERLRRRLRERVSDNDPAGPVR